VQPDPRSADGAKIDVPDAASILDDFGTLEKERDEYLGALQRLQADFENFRKRVDRQREEQAARAALDLVGKLLPVLDTLDLAEAHLSPGPGGEPSHDAKALTQVRAQLLDALSGEGLERVDAAEVVFDPVVHDAVAHTPAPPAPDPANGADGADGQGGSSAGHGETVVDEVLRSGYRWRGQVLRPAMVRVRG
jgi:molecular chaperone GrpE